MDQEERQKLFNLDDDELIGLIVVLLLIALLAFLWLRGMNNDGSETSDHSDSVAGEIVGENSSSEPIGSMTSTLLDADGTLQLAGSGHAGDQLDIQFNRVSVGSATVDSNGEWTYSTQVTQPGEYTVTVHGTDASGHEEMLDGSYRFIIADVNGQTVATPVEVVEPDEGTDDAEHSVDGSGDSADSVAQTDPNIIPATFRDNIDGITVNTPGIWSIWGNGTPDGQVAVRVNGQERLVQVGADGTWFENIDFSQPGTYRLEVFAVDGDGNVTGSADSAIVTIADPNAPAADSGTASGDGDGTGDASGEGDSTGDAAAGDGAESGTGDGSGDTSGEGTGDATDAGSGDGTGDSADAGDGSGEGSSDGSADAGEGAGDGSGEGAGSGEGNGTGDSAEQPAPTANIVDQLRATGQHNTLLAAIETAGLAPTLAGEGPFTIFAPSDEAFAQLPDGTVDSLLAQPTELNNLLSHHVVQGDLDAAAVEGSGTLTTLAGTPVTVARDENGALTIDGTPISQADVKTTNGTAHTIEGILLPPSDAFPAPGIDAEGVPQFKGTYLTVVGSATPGSVLVLELNGGLFGSTVVNDDGTWLVANDITVGEYDIIAYTFDTAGILRSVSETLHLIVTE